MIANSSANLRQIERQLQQSRNLGVTLNRMIEEGELTKDVFLTILSENHNVVRRQTIRKLISDKFITETDLEDSCGIDREFLDLLHEDDPVDPAMGSEYQAIGSIAKGSTEVYFWGMKSSGKSCALGAVLSMANNGGDRMMQQPCQGGDYMSRLSQIFKRDGEYTFLPAGTMINRSYEMRFSLIRDKKEHPLSLIDMSGEVFQSIYKKYTNSVMTTDETAALETLDTLLKEHASENRKIHFFVVEYGAESKKENGIEPNQYLRRAAEYLNHEGVFSEYTDAIYIILTKADRAGVFKSRDDEANHFRNYMSKHYRDFYFELKYLCEQHSINGGMLEFIPFSIGEVCFGDFCCFNSASAREILDYIVERSFYVERDFFGRIVRRLRT